MDAAPVPVPGLIPVLMPLLVLFIPLLLSMCVPPGPALGPLWAAGLTDSEGVVPAGRGTSYRGAGVHQDEDRGDDDNRGLSFSDERLDKITKVAHAGKEEIAYPLALMCITRCCRV